MIKEFKKFILRGNLIDLAIGFTVGAAFSTFVKSLVNDILMPPVSLLLGSSDFANLFVVIKKGLPQGPYTTLEKAHDAGATTLNIGNFLNNFISLVIVGVAMFLVIKLMNKFNEEMEERAGKKKDSKKTPSDKKCPHCFTTVPFRATRCPACTSELKVITGDSK
jgi:large conductance mechanosensitive channel